MIKKSTEKKPMELFVVSVTCKAYVFAKDETEARSFAEEIHLDTDPQYCDVTANKADKNVLGWSGDCCVYHAGSEDLLLMRVLQATDKTETPENGTSDA